MRVRLSVGVRVEVAVRDVLELGIWLGLAFALLALSKQHALVAHVQCPHTIPACTACTQCPACTQYTAYTACTHCTACTECITCTACTQSTACPQGPAFSQDTACSACM